MMMMTDDDDDIYMMWNQEFFDGNDSFHKTLYAKGNSRDDSSNAVIHPLDKLRSKKGDIHVYENNSTLYFVVMPIIDSFDEDRTIYFAKSDDGGTTTPKVIDVMGNPIQIPYKPRVSVDGNYIHVITDTSNERNCILYVSSNDAGQSFSEPINLSPNGSLE